MEDNKVKVYVSKLSFYPKVDDMGNISGNMSFYYELEDGEFEINEKTKEYVQRRGWGITRYPIEGIKVYRVYGVYSGVYASHIFMDEDEKSKIEERLKDSVREYIQNESEEVRNAYARDLNLFNSLTKYEKTSMTNGDWIRSLSDEDLAKFFNTILNQEDDEWNPIGCFNCIYYGTHHQPEECHDCEFKEDILGWLKKEHKE